MIRVPLSGLAATALVGAALTGVILLKNAEETRLRAVIAAHDGCVGAVTNGGLDASASRCPPAVAAAHRDQVRTRACDAALKSGDLFAQRAACSAEVKTVTAERTAALGERDDARRETARLRADHGAALARAEARGRTQALRTHELETRLEGVPSPDPGGLRRCDADCLRNLGA